MSANPMKGLPVRVQGVEVQDPILVLFGDGWGLTIACPWRGTIAGRAASWEDDNIEDTALSLVGEELTAVLQDGQAVTFEFSIGSLTAIPDTDIDPWVLQLPDGLLVGRMLRG